MVTVIDEETQQVILGLLENLVDGFERRDALCVYDNIVQFVARARESFFSRGEERGEEMRGRSQVA
jgi:hypothetical protein